MAETAPLASSLRLTPPPPLCRPKTCVSFNPFVNRGVFLLLCTLLSLHCTLAFHVPAVPLWSATGAKRVMPTRRLERVGGLALKATSGDKDSEKEEEKREKAKLEAGTERKKLEKEGLEPDSEEPSALAKAAPLSLHTYVVVCGADIGFAAIRRSLIWGGGPSW
eukprot:3407755-Rhodomonas_salina.2